MFVELTKEEKMLASSGTMTITPVLKSGVQHNISQNNVPYYVSMWKYNSKTPAHIFRFMLTMAENIIMFEDITANHDPLAILDESSMYFYLSKLFEQSQIWAWNNRKSTLILESGLPHMTEFFVEYKFKFGISHGNGGLRRGLKTLNLDIISHSRR